MRLHGKNINDKMCIEVTILEMSTCMMLHLQHKRVVLNQCLFLIILSDLDFMPGLTSTTLSETWTTRTVTSPDSGWLCRFRKSLTRVSKYMPSLVCGSPEKKKLFKCHY